MEKEDDFPTETDIDVITISKQNEHPSLSHAQARIQAKYELEEVFARSKKIAYNGLKP